MRAHGDADVRQHAVAGIDRGAVDRNAGIIHEAVHHPERIGLWRPLIAVDSLRDRPVVDAFHLVDRDHLAGLRSRNELAVLEAPPCCGVAAERLVAVGGIGAQARRDVDDLQFDEVVRTGPADRDRPGADVHAESLAGAAPAHRRIHRAGAAAVDRLMLRCPMKYRFRAGIAAHHPVVVVAAVLRQRFDGDEVAAVDLEHRRNVAAEVTPVDRRLGRREMVMTRSCGTPRQAGGGLRVTAVRMQVSRGRGGGVVRQGFLVLQQVRRFRPATIGVLQNAMRHLGGGGTAEIARRDAERIVEGAAEVRGVVEAPAEADVRYRQVRVRRIGQILAGTLEPAHAHEVEEALAVPLEQLLHIAHRSVFRRRDVGNRRAWGRRGAARWRRRPVAACVRPPAHDAVAAVGRRTPYGVSMRTGGRARSSRRDVHAYLHVLHRRRHGL